MEIQSLNAFWAGAVVLSLRWIIFIIIAINILQNRYNLVVTIVAFCFMFDDLLDEWSPY